MDDDIRAGMKRLVGSFVAFAFLLLPAIAARADERGTYVTLDRDATDNAVGLNVVGHFYSVGAPDFGMRENLFGRYVNASGFGAFGQVSVSHAFNDGSSTNGVSDLELGGLYARHLDGADLFLRLGIGVPTASSSSEGVFSNAVNMYDRLVDAALTAPRTVWLRPGTALRVGERKLFYAADFGFDIPIKVEDGAASDVLFHAAAGAGTTQGPVALTAEAALFAERANGWHTLTSATASARYVDGPLSPFVAYTATFSFDRDIHGVIHSLTAGIQGRF